jgi:hypothetical protein
LSFFSSAAPTIFPAIEVLRHCARGSTPRSFHLHNAGNTAGAFQAAPAYFFQDQIRTSRTARTTMESSNKNWSMGFTSSYRYPVVTHRCPSCLTVTTFQVGDGVVPDAKCCAKREHYPSTPEFRHHLRVQANHNGFGDAGDAFDASPKHWQSRLSQPIRVLSSLLGKKLKTLW